MNGNILIDGHVHIHEAFELPVVLGAALRNFEAAAHAAGLQQNARFVLLLCDEGGYPAWRSLSRAADSGASCGDWSLEKRAEPGVIVASSGVGGQLLILAGRQVQTLDGLELLALCTVEDHPDGLPIDASIDRVIQYGDVGVLPWGFMKWLGRRGRRVADLLRGSRCEGLLLGDNAGRWSGLPEPKEFATGRRRGLQVLAGTDPLPFPSQATRVGSYGSLVSGPFDDARIRESVRSLLRRPNVLTPYGRRERIIPFVLNQSRMQIRNRLRSDGLAPA